KPHETSMFIRLQKETVDQEEQSMDIIYKLLRSEYLRRGAGFPLEILDRELIRATKLSKNNVYSLVGSLARINMNISLTDEKDDHGRYQKFVDFTSVLEKFDKKGVAQKKAKKYLSDRLFTTMTSKKPKQLDLHVDTNQNKGSDQFISSLTSDYKKKQRDELSFEKKQKDISISFTQKNIPQALKNNIIDILKKEYVYRIENQEKYPDFHYCISEIASQIQMGTRITPGQLYPILENIAAEDLALSLEKNPDEPEDKRINFFPIADDDLSHTLANFRPEVYEKIRIKITKQFFKFLNRKKSKAIFPKLRKQIGGNTEEQKAWNEIYKILNNFYPKHVEIVEGIRLGTELPKILKVFPKKDIDIFNIDS
ncbi:MAG: hypothetical protein ACTSQU_18380, partial [Promethearchaeota archaeon]